MWKTTLLVAASVFLACSNPSGKEVSQGSNVVKNNFAVTWKWSTSDISLVEKNHPEIISELTDLWKKGVIENVYYDTGLPEESLEQFPNIAFFLKAHSESDALALLNGLTIVKKRISTYEIHPVGTLWLDRKTDVINSNGITKSFVTVWTTKEAYSDSLVQQQNDKVLDLWNKGLVENVYFDIEGTQGENSITDFVLFVNANTQVEAEAICADLPFTAHGIATYDIYPSGTFWMGTPSKE